MTDDEKADEGFQGGIGHNLYYSREEQEEDILETIYQWWKDEEDVTAARVCEQFNLAKRETAGHIRHMIEHGYLRETESGEIALTAFGKAEGAECLRRHKHLTHFLQMTCGMDADGAEENACRMEHVVSSDVMKGICDFIRYGDTYDRIAKGANLRSFYDVGTYEFCMGIYDVEKRYPRVLAEENSLYSDTITLDVGNEESAFYLRANVGAEQMQSGVRIFYKSEYDWKQAEKTERGVKLPTEAFTFMFSPKRAVTEGYCLLAICGDDRNRPDESCYREMNVHIW